MVIPKASHCLGSASPKPGNCHIVRFFEFHIVGVLQVAGGFFGISIASVLVQVFLHFIEPI